MTRPLAVTPPSDHDRRRSIHSLHFCAMEKPAEYLPNSVSTSLPCLPFTSFTCRLKLAWLPPAASPNLASISGFLSAPNTYKRQSSSLTCLAVTIRQVASCSAPLPSVNLTRRSFLASIGLPSITGLKHCDMYSRQIPD